MIEQLKIQKLTLLENNPRKISREQLQKLKESLTSDPTFLEKRPVLVNRVIEEKEVLEDGTEFFHYKYIVYAGNQRVRAAKALGWKMIPCLVDYNIDKELMKSRAIKDNKSVGSWDYDILANDFELTDLVEWGFTTDELMGCVDILKGEEPKKEKEKKEKTCPRCGEIL